MNKLIKTYIGFSLKSRSVIIGQDQLKSSKSKVELIIYCSTASNNLKDLAVRLSEKYKCNNLCLDSELENYTSIQGCKIIGITNSSLANAIMAQAKQDKLMKLGGNYGE